VKLPTIRFNILYDDDDADEWYEDGSSLIHNSALEKGTIEL
jgi:hypothetical protein